MTVILGSSTMIEQFRDRRVSQSKQKNGSPMNEKTYLLSSHDKLEKESETSSTDDFFEEEYLSLYDCSLEIYQQYESLEISQQYHSI